MAVGLAQRVVKEWKEFVGPEAMATDNVLTLGLAASGAIAAPRLASPGNGAVRDLVLVALALDLWGGAWANNTRACARWYERPGQTDADHLKFAAMHVHPLVVAWMDRGGRQRILWWAWAVAQYGYLMTATVLIRRSPGRRRLLGVALTAGGVALDAALGPSRAAPWFAPIYYTKLVLGHAAAARWPDAELTGPVRAE